MMDNFIRKLMKKFNPKEITKASTETKHDGAPSEAEISANRYQYELDQEQKRAAESNAAWYQGPIYLKLQYFKLQIENENLKHIAVELFKALHKLEVQIQDAGRRKEERDKLFQQAQKILGDRIEWYAKLNGLPRAQKG